MRSRRPILSPCSTRIPNLGARSRAALAPLIAIACASTPASPDTTTTGTSSDASATADSSDADSSPSSATDPSNATTSTAVTSDPDTTASDSTISDGSSSESGGLPDCLVTQGCSCVLGLCAGNQTFNPLACVDGICVPAVCGNGELDDGEACDDNNAVTSDDCTSECLEAICGDDSLHMTDEWCDGPDGAICGVACDAQPTGWVSLAVTYQCALAVDPGVGAYAGLGRPTNEVRAYDAATALRWTVAIDDGDVESVATHGDADVIAGITVEPFGNSDSWLRRWTSDGALIGDTPLATEQANERIRDLERRGDDLWVLTHNFAPGASGGNHLCRYDAALEPIWCTPILQFDDLLEEAPKRVALSSTGRAAVAVEGQQASLWIVDADGTVELTTTVDVPGLTSMFLGLGLAFSPDDQSLAIGFAGAQGSAAAALWGVYDLSGTPQRLAQSTVRDLSNVALVGWAPSGDLVIGQSVNWGSNYPWIAVETGDGALRYVRRGSGAPGLDSQLCDLVVADNAVWVLGSAHLPDRTFMSRFELE